jgi:hypothetical protein
MGMQKNLAMPVGNCSAWKMMTRSKAEPRSHSGREPARKQPPKPAAPRCYERLLERVVPLPFRTRARYFPV